MHFCVITEDCTKMKTLKTQNGLLTYSLKKAEITKRPIYSTCT